MGNFAVTQLSGFYVKLKAANPAQMEPLPLMLEPTTFIVIYHHNQVPSTFEITLPKAVPPRQGDGEGGI